jgi:predicted ATP-dependent endonuclease of OLD family
MYDTVPKSTRFLTISFQNNTITQLKNSGNLRLIRNKEVTDSLAKYWNECDYLINTQLASYEVVRIKSKELIFSLFNLNYFENNSLTNPLRKNISLKLMSDDRAQFITLGNYLSNSYTQLNSLLNGSIFQRLMTINRKATDLITLIQKEYHIE